MARWLAVRSARCRGRSLASTTARRYSSSVPESEHTLAAAAATEARIKKGAGKGTMAERILAVVDKIHQRRLPPELRRGGAAINATADPARVEVEVVNVAEQRILRSMMNGDFENLPGRGKPLRLERNSQADPAEDMAYRILARNGFAPEWIELNKEIRVLIERWRAALVMANQRRMLASAGGLESEAVSLAWKNLLRHFEKELGDINRKVLKYNLLAPFGRQVMSYKLEKELLLLQKEKPSKK